MKYCMRYLVLMSAMVIGSVNAESKVNHDLLVDRVINYFDGLMSEQLDRMHKNPLIKSKEDLMFYSSQSYENFPLNHLTGEDKELFIQSLTFNEKGLTGFNVKVLQQLDKGEVYQILSLFGFGTFSDSVIESQDNNKVYGDDDGTVEGDFLIGYFCESKGTCKLDAQAACTKNC